MSRKSDYPKTKFPKNFCLIPGTYHCLNPGNIENIHRRTRNIMPQFFDGVRFTCNRSLAINKLLSGNWILSNIYPSGLRIGGKYYMKVDENILQGPIIEVDFNPSTLSSYLSLLYHPFPWLRLQTEFQRLQMSKIGENRITAEVLSSCSTTTLKTYNADIKAGRITLSYLRTLTERLSAGAELQLDWCDKVVAFKTAYAVRYGTDRFQIATTFSRDALDISFWQRVQPAIQVGSSLAFSRLNDKSIGSIYYQWEFQNAFVRAMINSEWTTGFMYSRKIEKLPCTVGCSLMFAIPNNRVSLGLTFDFDSGTGCPC